jgi:hypothetical protein
VMTMSAKKSCANNRAETNPAITLRLQSEMNWRGVVYPNRSAGEEHV